MAIAHHPERGEFELELDGRRAGYLTYREEHGRALLLHVEVEPALRGRGLGALLARAALEDVRARGLEPVPI